jgi:hypothetical protein
MSARHCEKCGGPEPGRAVHPEIVHVRAVVERFHKALRAEVRATKAYFWALQTLDRNLAGNARKRADEQIRGLDVARRRAAAIRSDAGQMRTPRAWPLRFNCSFARIRHSAPSAAAGPVRPGSSGTHRWSSPATEATRAMRGTGGLARSESPEHQPRLECRRCARSSWNGFIGREVGRQQVSRGATSARRA